MAGGLGISAAFEGGSIEGIDATDPADIRVRLRADTHSPDTHWFHFRLTGARGIPCRITIENSDRMARLAGRDEVPDCWTGYRPFACDDGVTWRRTGAEYAGGRFSILHTPATDAVEFAHFPPYSTERHRNLVARLLADDRVRLEVPGQTPGARDLDLLRLGRRGAGRPKCWIVARQHPGETMASFFVEGFLERLLDPACGLARHLLDEAEFFVVPMANPDGCATGNTRTNARGFNLNRAWAEPDPDLAPEVVLIRDRMLAEGVDFFLDVHGDEELPYIFLGGPLEIPSRSDRVAALFRRYQQAQARANPDFRPSDPYPGGAPAEADLRMAWNWVGEHFGSLSILLEQPFKDTTHTPDAGFGWSPARSHALGRSTLDALADVLPDLR